MSSKKDNSPPSSVFSRSIKLFGTTVKIVGKEVGIQATKIVREKVEETTKKVKEKRLQQALALAETLGQLKGAAMKAGQLLSLDAADILPPELSQAFSGLQNKAPAVSFEKIYAILKSELGEKLDEIKNLSKTPLAAASIGQVHTGVIEGEKVAIKIQYPGVMKAIDSDLRVMKTLAQSAVRVAGKKANLDELFKEFKYVLELEANYLMELKNLKSYNEYLKSGPEYIHIPKVFEYFTTSKVITMGYEEGQTLSEWLDTKPSYEKKVKLGRWILEHHYREFFEWGLVQTDPNMANFLVRKGGQELVLLDFGAVLSYEKEFREDYRNLLIHLFDGDIDAVFKLSYKHDLISERESKETKEAFIRLLNVAIEPFDKNKQPFSFQNDDYRKITREVVFDFVNKLKYSPPPRKLIFLHRKLGGIYQILRRMDVALDLHSYYNQFLKN